MEPDNSQHSEASPPSRRSFFWWLTAGMSALAGVAVGIPLIGYFFGTRERRVKWVKLGKVSEFPVDETRLRSFENLLRQPWDGMTANTSVFVRNLGKDKDQKEQFLLLAVNCAHLGCPVAWFPQSGLFMCPCHGGVYYANGERASGPPPHGLFHCDWKVDKGQLWVQAPHYPTEQDPLVKDNKPRA
jgi:menaquinol-cytochrome c reductase iron-sulfur subunit